MSRRDRFLCMDCKRDTSKLGEHYFVRTPLWIEAVGSKRGMLCVGDLERRLGRRLAAADFTACFLNDPRRGDKSARLLDRLGRTR